ncbi:CD209 antigen-like protein C isoform X2 [Lissotriton helveticus]
MRNKPLYVNQRSCLDSPGNGYVNFQLVRPNHGLKATKRLVIVSLILSFLMSASLVVTIVMYFQKVIHLKDIEHEAKNLADSFKTHNPVTAPVMDPSGRCNNKPTDGWKLNGTYLYYFSTETKNWCDAKKFCIDNNSDLVSITSKEEQLYLESTRGNNYYWIGLTNDKPGGHWHYADGSAYKEPFFWAPNQPGNRKTLEKETELCAEMYDGGRWYERICTLHLKWICKKQCDRIKK